MAKLNLKLCSLLTMALSTFLLCGLVHAENYQPNLPADEVNKWQLVKQAEFNEDTLDTSLFTDIYLPHWSELDLVKANYVLGGGQIRLLIDKYQSGWRPGTRQQISSIQTGMKDGLHIWDKSLPISGHYPAIDNYATKYGYFELRAKAQNGGGIHSAWWMVGDQNQYDKSAEVDIFEILGKDVHTNDSRVWVTIHPWYDTVIRKQHLDYWVNTDISADYHTYGFEWTDKGMKWYFDGRLVRSTKQSPDYKMYTLLGIYQSWGGTFSWQGAVDEGQLYPKSFDIDYFRVYKTKEMLDNDEKEAAAKQKLAEQIPSTDAIFGGDFTWDWYHQPGHLNDNNFKTTLQSIDNPKFPMYIYADFKKTTELSQMNLYTHYGRGQGITDLVLEYFDEDEQSWHAIANVQNFAWLKNNHQIETMHVEFPHKVTTKHMRVKVINANLTWRHFAVNELQFI